MELIPVDVTLISATGLKDVNLLSKMDVYAVVSISGTWAQEPKQRTPVDKDSGPNPKWNHTVRLVVPEAQALLTLNVKLVSRRTFGDKGIGEVNVPIKDLLDGTAAETGAEKRLSYAVGMKNGKSKGTLDLSYKLGEKYTAPAPKAAPEPAPVYTYPAQAPGPAYPYPAPQPGYAYPMPPPPQQAGYGYPVGQPGHGYLMAAQKPHKPKRGGGNMALGLGAGLLGGLLIGDMVSDVAAYDAGFDDAGFDF